MKKIKPLLLLLSLFMIQSIHAQDMQLFNLNEKPIAFMESRHYLCVETEDGNGTRKNHIYRVSDMKEVTTTEKEVMGMTDGGYLTTNTFNKKSTFYSFDGKKLWSYPHQAIVTVENRYKNIGLFAHIKWNKFSWNKDMTSVYTIGVDMNTGKQLWERYLPYKVHYPFQHFVISLDSTTAYVVGDSLIKLNLLNGEYKSRPFNGGRPSTVAQRFGKGVMREGIALDKFSQMTYHDYLASGSVVQYMVTGSHSNMVIYRDSMYIADADSLYCFDKDLNENWVTALPKDLGSASALRRDEGKLRLVNYGVCFLNYKQIRIGKPFVATYDRNTGEQLTMVIDDEKVKNEEFVPKGRYDFKMRDGRTIVLYGKGFAIQQK